MKHIKLFEDFGNMQNGQTLPPSDVLKNGETALVFTIADDVMTTILPVNEVEGFVRKIKGLFNRPPFTVGVVETSSQPGTAYVFCDADNGYQFSFESASFEPQTSNIPFWVNGNQSDVFNLDSPEDYGSTVYTLKRGMVIVASAGSGGPEVREETIEDFLNKNWNN